MKTSSNHILTSHAGSLPRPDDLIAAWGANDERALTKRLTASVAEVVRRQKEIGIDVPGDGEFGKPMAQRVNYGSWWRYSWNRLGGLDPHGPSLYEPTFARFRAVSGKDHASGRLEQGKSPSPRAKGDRSWRSTAPQR